MKHKLTSSFFLLFIYFISLNAQETYSPNLKSAIDGKGWKSKFIKAELSQKDSTDAVLITQTEADDLVWLEDFEFTNGVIEFDAKGKSAPPQSSFVGIAFRVVDEKTYDAVYFRPFNFRSPNPESKAHSVQYISQPDWTWRRLRMERTGQYEKPIEPAPNGDEWFHVKIVIQKPEIKVYVNNADEPSLVVNELSERKGGSIGLWCNGFGMIANLKITELK